MLVLTDMIISCSHGNLSETTSKHWENILVVYLNGLVVVRDWLRSFEYLKEKIQNSLNSNLHGDLQMACLLWFCHLGFCLQR